jgi:hypothetical protein
VWFGWTKLGGIDLEAGVHTLVVQADGHDGEGRYLLALDGFLVTPQAPGREVLAQSGEKGPVLARQRVGKGTVTITQLLMADRLDPASPSYDPAAERLFYNLLSL